MTPGGIEMDNMKEIIKQNNQNFTDYLNINNSFNIKLVNYIVKLFY